MKKGLLTNMQVVAIAFVISSATAEKSSDLSS